MNLFALTWTALFLALNLYAADTDRVGHRGQIDPTTILVKARGLEDDFHRKMGAGHKKLKHVNRQQPRMAFLVSSD